MDLNLIRQESSEKLARIGYIVGGGLPLLDSDKIMRSTDQAVSRLLCLHALAACAYGFDRKKINIWIGQESLSDSLTEAEKKFVESGVGDPNKFKFGVEAIWALAWCLNYLKDLDFFKECSNDFVLLLPNIKISEKCDVFRSRAVLRSDLEVVRACDFAYCLHWAIRNDNREKLKAPNQMHSYVLEERRRALEWILSAETWDEVSIDT